MRLEDLLNEQDIKITMDEVAAQRNPQPPNFSDGFVNYFREISDALAEHNKQSSAVVFAIMMTAVCMIDETLKNKMEKIL